MTSKLIEGGFIDKNTDSERLEHILSGDPYDGDVPVQWIKKASRNGSPSKASVLNFLHLMGVKPENITPDRLNCCFICSGERKLIPFKRNNITKEFKSEYVEDLKTILESVFKEGHLIRSYIDKLYPKR